MKIDYRPEIDGLRAIAALSVALFHLQISIFGFQIFSGGYIGVDIFFVISGYLISSIIFKELKEKRSFSLIKFYERRIRRILPVLIFVIISSMFIGWKYLYPASLVNFSKSIIASLGFVSNHYFHYTAQAYAAENSLFLPFLHTWSLSIEEQFYIIFPIIILIIFKFFKNYLLLIILLVTVFSLFLAEWSSRNYVVANFYFLPTRVWELLAGSILAYLNSLNLYRNRISRFNFLLPSAGFILIFFYIFLFNENSRHPSFTTIIPIIGVCLIIWFANKNDFITQILSSKVLVFIGLISYSIYLWHYPIFSFYRITEILPQTNYIKILLLFSVILISIFTYFFIEKPFRNQKFNFKIVLPIIIFFLLIIVIINLIIVKEDGFKKRLPQLLSQNLESKPWRLLKNSEGKNCNNNLDGCIFNKNSNNKIFIVGDSHMATLMYGLKKKLENRDFQFITINGCLYFPGFNVVNKKTNKIDKKCNDENFQKIKTRILQEDGSIVIFGGRYPMHLNKEFFDNKEGGIEGKNINFKYVSVGNYKTIEQSFRNEIQELSKKNKVILIYPIPEIGWNPLRKIYLQWIKKEKDTKNFTFSKITTSFDVYSARSRSTFELFDSVKNKNIHRVYPDKLFCNKKIKGRCITHDNKNFFYIDDDHLSLKGSDMLNNLIIDQLNILEK